MLHLAARDAIGGLLAGEQERITLPTIAEWPRAELAVEGEENLSRPPQRGGGPTGMSIVICD